MKWFLGPLVAVCLMGCVREPARQATLGALDAIDRPDPNNALAMKVHVLADRYVEAALKAAPPPRLDAMIGDVLGATLQAFQAHGPQELMMMRVAVRSVLEESLATVKRQVAVPSGGGLGQSSTAISSGLVAGVTQHQDEIASMLSRSTGEVGRALVRETSDQLFAQIEAQLGPNGEGPLSRSVAASLERATGAIVQGATAHAGEGVGLCTSSDPAECQGDVVRRMSRSATLGAMDGVRGLVSPMALAGAVLAGILISVAAHALVVLLGRRSAPHRGRASGHGLRHLGDRPRRPALRRHGAHARRRQA